MLSFKGIFHIRNNIPGFVVVVGVVGVVVIVVVDVVVDVVVVNLFSADKTLDSMGSGDITMWLINIILIKSSRKYMTR